MQAVTLHEQIGHDNVEALLAGLTSISLELTNNCNLSCVHCYADSSPHEPLNEGMTFHDWKTVLEQAAALNCETVRFIGGEPTAYPHLIELLVAARELGFKNVFLYTNGTRLSRRLRDSLVRYSVGLAFSLYAASPDSHDVVTRVRGSFTKTVDSIRWAVSRGLDVQVSITRIADQGEIDAATAMVRQMGVRVISYDRVRRIGRGGGNALNENVSELCGSCWQGKLCVTPSGSIHPCVFSRFEKVGSVSQGIAQAVNSPALRIFREHVLALEQKHDARRLAITYGPGADSDPCNPEKDPGPCSPEKDPGPCSPEKDPGPCSPEKDPGPCSPEKDPGPCNPEKPAW